MEMFKVLNVDIPRLCIGTLVGIGIAIMGAGVALYGAVGRFRPSREYVRYMLFLSGVIGGILLASVVFAWGMDLF